MGSLFVEPAANSFDLDKGLVSSITFYYLPGNEENTGRHINSRKELKKLTR